MDAARRLPFDETRGGKNAESWGEGLYRSAILGKISEERKTY